MFYYPTKAVTIKTIKKFNYRLYNDISINMLKYNNDSSNTINILGSHIDSANDTIEDFVYKPRFNLKDMDFITIDRFNGYFLDKIFNISYTKDDTSIHCNDIQGYSKYTGNIYTLEQVENNNDFTRHSLPCDCFFGNYTDGNWRELITLYPNVKTEIGLKVLDSAVTIKPYSGLNQSSMIDTKITLLLNGITLTNNLIEESVTIDSYREIKTSNIYREIRSIKMIGSITSIKIVLYSYVNGEIINYNQDIIDRETLHNYPCTIDIDKTEKALRFNIINDNMTQFPINYEPYRLVNFNIQSNENIIGYYIDNSNKLVYVVTDSNLLYCFPLIIPIKYDNSVLKEKTKYQSARIEYYDDSINKEYTFYIFPTNKTNDIEIMSIFINNEEYESNLLLDLYRENIETNRFILPYSELFKNGDTAIVKFISYGINESITPIFISNPKLEPLYIKDLTIIPSFANQIEQYSSPDITSNNAEYKEFINGDISNIDYSIFKISSKDNIIINGYEIINVFNTFYYDDEYNMIITSDTISGVKGL